VKSKFALLLLTSLIEIAEPYVIPRSLLTEIVLAMKEHLWTLSLSAERAAIAPPDSSAEHPSK
jgi:hypothetical protein